MNNPYMMTTRKRSHESTLNNKEQAVKENILLVHHQERPPKIHDKLPQPTLYQLCGSLTGEIPYQEIQECPHPRSHWNLLELFQANCQKPLIHQRKQHAAGQYGTFSGQPLRWRQYFSLFLVFLDSGVLFYDRPLPRQIRQLSGRKKNFQYILQIIQQSYFSQSKGYTVNTKVKIKSSLMLK